MEAGKVDNASPEVRVIVEDETLVWVWTSLSHPHKA